VKKLFGERNFDEYTQVLAGDTTNKMAFLGGEEGASLCIALLCTIVLRRRLSSKKRSIIHKNFLHRVHTNLNSSFLDSSFLEWRLGCKTCIVYTGLKQ
jgi:hypothetical protein